jgi:hypothetical protein
MIGNDSINQPVNKMFLFLSLVQKDMTLEMISFKIMIHENSSLRKGSDNKKGQQVVHFCALSKIG